MLPLHHGAPPSHGGPAVPAEMLKVDFTRQDSNGNGAVDLAEFEAFHLTMMKSAFGNIDSNKDGVIDRTEHAAVMAQLPKGAQHPDFSALDGNGDGKLSEDEFFAAHH